MVQLAGSAGPKGGPERGPGQSAAKMMHLSALTLLLAQFSALLLSVGAAPMFDQVPPQGLIPNTEAPPVQQKPFVAYRRPGQKPKGKLYDNYPKTNWTSFLGGQRPTTKLAPNAPAQLRSVAYFPSWSYADVPLSTDVTSRLTHVVYAFMSMSYIGGRWYLDFINPDSETKICPAGGNCWDPSTSDQCLWLPPTSSCDGGRTIALSPRFGFSKCTWDTCWNKMDAWKSPPCQTTVQNGMCGQLGYLMKKVKSNPANKGIRFMLGVGGASHSNYFSHATDAPRIGSFVQSIVSTAISLGFDGVDIDWEFPTFERGGQPLPGQRSSGAYGEGFDCLSQTCSFRGRMRDAAKYVDLMRKLRTAFDLRGRNRYGERYQISAALPATNYYADRFDSGAICAAADFVNVMTYDYYGGWSQTTGANSGIYNPDDMASSIHGSLSMYETRGCPRSKMNVGVPFYGMVFNSVAPGPLKIGIGAKFTPVNYDTTRKYPEMLALLREPGWKVYYDNSTWSRSQTQVGYNAVTKQFATFETPWSVTQKRNYALQTGAGGLLYWALGMDDASNSLLKAAMPVPIARGTAGGRDNGRGPIDSSNTILVGKLLVEGKGGK